MSAAAGGHDAPRDREVRRERHRFDVVKNQAAHVQKTFDAMDTARSRRVLLHGWEEFDEPVDRIVSIGAFEHFGYDRYDDFFGKAYSILPDDGVMLLHTITMLTGPQIVERGLPLSEEQTSFNEFIATEIFPGGQLPAIEMVEFHSAKMGFNLTRRQSLQLHYARTLDHWAEALEAHQAERRTPMRCRRDRGSSGPTRMGRPQFRRARSRAH